LPQISFVLCFGLSDLVPACSIQRGSSFRSWPSFYFLYATSWCWGQWRAWDLPCLEWWVFPSLYRTLYLRSCYWLF